MRALIAKGGAAQPSDAADGLAEKEKKSTAVSATTVDKDLPKHGNGKPQNVKNVTWGANTVQEYHTECNGSRLLEDVDMRAEDAGDDMVVKKNSAPPTPKQRVPEREMKAKSGENNKKQEVQYVPKVKVEEAKAEESTPHTKVSIQHDKKDIYKN